MQKKYILLDSAMGTQLQAGGLPPGAIPEIWGMQHPEIVEEIHRRNIRAGSEVIYTNTFGANRLKLEGSGISVEKVVRANVEAAKRSVRGTSVKIALDIGPSGALLKPLGTMAFEEAVDVFREIVTAGEEAGADLVIFETFTDLYEMKAAVLAARENTKLPVWTTMSFEENGRTFLGTDAAAMAMTLEGLGVSALGINCSLGPAEILPIAREMRRWTGLPMIIKPNAGLPDPRTGAYAIGAEEFAGEMVPFLKMGVRYLGGCCGTTPDFVRALADRSRAVSEMAEEPEAAAGSKSAAAPESAEASNNASPECRGICSASKVTVLDGRVNVIGERINPTGKKRFQQALRSRDMNYVTELAIQQQEAGADILDINVGVPGLPEAELMAEVVQAVQSVTDLPLQIDSTNPEAVEAGLRVLNGRGIVNSVNGEKEKQDRILPIVKKYGAAVVGLAMDEKGLPKTAEDRVRVARNILEACGAYGIPREDVFIDCLTLTVSAQQDQAMETLRAVERIHRELGLHCVLGVSNISFGLPARAHVTASFLTQAMYCGLDLPIINPNQKAIMDAVASFRALSGSDENCSAYIERFAEEERAAKAEGRSGGGSTGHDGTSTGLNSRPDGASADQSGSAGGETDASPAARMLEAVLKGRKREAERLTRDFLSAGTPGMEIIDRMIIPALDVVGDRYETGEIFLPQLINAANAACAGLDLIKAGLQEQEAAENRGTILIATVQGDIHDIGKNIVKVVLENYGYRIIDLGRDVKPETIVETVRREHVGLVGLSALMTTTVGAMRRTIEAIHEADLPCRIMVGGAVMTVDFAKEIGADYYVADAKASCDVAKKVLG